MNPVGTKFGNSMSVIKYQANGEASDWMLAEHGIYSMGIEMGTSDNRTNVFFIEDEAVLQSLLEQNHPWIFYSMQKLLPEL